MNQAPSDGQAVHDSKESDHCDKPGGRVHGNNNSNAFPIQPEVPSAMIGRSFGWLALENDARSYSHLANIDWRIITCEAWRQTVGSVIIN